MSTTLQIFFSAGFVVLALVLAFQVVILYLLLAEAKQKESEYFTDYTHKRLILRIYKPEFEYQAIGKLNRDQLLDRGTFSQFYFWALIQK